MNLNVVKITLKMYLDLQCMVDAPPPLLQLPLDFIPITYNQYTLDRSGCLLLGNHILSCSFCFFQFTFIEYFDFADVWLV